MNRNQSDRYSDAENSRTHRSERYRHPDEDNNYGSRSRGGDGNQANDRGNPRNVANHSMNEDTYSTSRNYGNMGSYGGAQGFGSDRGGQHPAQRNDSSGYNYYSGMGSPDETRQRNLSSPGSSSNMYGGRGSYDSDNRRYSRGSDRGMSSNSGNRDLFGNDTSRRFEGSDQGHYNFDNDNYNSHSYGGDSRGNYMGSGYNRNAQGRDNYSGFGSSGGGYMSGGSHGSTSDRYGMSGYFEGNRGNAESDYIRSQNQNRTFDRNHDRRDRNNSNFDRH